MQVTHYNKAPHSSYVCIGAELGKPGLFLFLGVLYCCLRTTITARTQTPDEERIRRILFVLVVSYMVSSWMVDFEYRPTFFMFAAAIAALPSPSAGSFRRSSPCGGNHARRPSPAGLAHSGTATTTRLRGIPADSMLAPGLMEPATLASSSALPATPFIPRIAGSWNRLKWFDFAAVLLLTWGAIHFWAYLIVRM